MTKKTMLVSDYMRPVNVTITLEQTFRDAVEIMIKHKTNGLVVTDDKNKVIGILSSWDIIQHIVPDYLEFDKHLAAFEEGDVFSKRVIDLQNDSVSKFYTPKVHSVHTDSLLIEAATILSEFHVRQLPVVNSEDVLVGYLNRTDIKLVVGEILGIKTN